MPLGSVNEFVGWLPIGFTFGPQVSVRWLEFGGRSLSEPFFGQSVRALRCSKPPARERVTNLQTLFDVASAYREVEPSGLIFHVSRCGSTFLTNILKAGAGVLALSEA